VIKNLVRTNRTLIANGLVSGFRFDPLLMLAPDEGVGFSSGIPELTRFVVVLGPNLYLCGW
jgi:hypothetical protein